MGFFCYNNYVYKTILFLLFSSTIFASDNSENSVPNILEKYKNIKEEMKDRKAIVKTSDAIIFADVGLNYPVHKIRKGRVLKLANFEVKLENVFPVLINGGVGYIRSGDIDIQKVFSVQSASRLEQHNVDFMYEENVSRLEGRKDILIKRVSFNAGTNWTEFSDLAGDTAEAITGYQFLVEFHPRAESFGFGVGPSYYKVEQEKVKMSTWALEGQVNYSPIKWRLFQWDLHLGAGFSSGLDIELDQIDGVNKGYFYSWNIGTAIRILPDYKIGGIIGVNYRTWNISGMKDVVFPDAVVADLNGFSGADIFFGLSYKF